MNVIFTPFDGGRHSVLVPAQRVVRHPLLTPTGTNPMVEGRQIRCACCAMCFSGIVPALDLRERNPAMT